MADQTKPPTPEELIVEAWKLKLRNALHARDQEWAKAVKLSQNHTDPSVLRALLAEVEGK